MRTAFLTDIHANREALTACLYHAEARGVDRYVFLGDYVGYGADPEWTLEKIHRYVQDGAIAVLGNHDHATIHGVSDEYQTDAGLVIQWTQKQISRPHLNFLTSLPLFVAEADAFFAHANAWAPDTWRYILNESDAARSMSSSNTRLSFFGHLHLPGIYSFLKTPQGPPEIHKTVPVECSPISFATTHQWLVIPGAVGQARDGIPAASYSIYDDQHTELTFFRVAYDIEAAAKKIEKAKLPQIFAERLRQGV